jgi:hypothetical protein
MVAADVRSAKQIELLFLDPVLDLAAGAVEVLVKGARANGGGRK